MKFIFLIGIFYYITFLQAPTFDFKKSTKIGEQIILTKYTGSIKEVNIPSSYKGLPLNVIGGYEQDGVYHGAFEATNVETVVIPDKVIIIESLAFFRCENLLNITFSQSIKIIGESAFESCSQLKEIKLPASIERLSNRAFAGCTNLKSITFANDIKEIGDEAFIECDDIENITLPPSIRKIGNSAFKDCTKLKVLRIEATTPPLFNTNIFGDIPKELIIQVPKNREEVYKNDHFWRIYVKHIVGY